MSKIIKIKCDVCKKNKNNRQDDWLTITNHWGYNSNKDQELHQCIICSDCWDKIDEYIETLGGKVRKYIYEMLTGDILDTKDRYIKNLKRIKNDLRKAPKIQRRKTRHSQ